MSIALLESSDVDLKSFLAAHGFFSQALHGVDVKGEMQQALKANRSIWSRVDDANFTNHDHDHSLNIVGILAEFDKLYHFNDAEKLILVLASFMHDVGMQYNSWAVMPSRTAGRAIWQELGTPQPPLSPEQIRETHVAHGAALLNAEIDDERVWDDPPAFSTSQDQLAKIFFEEAFKVAFAHSKGGWWDKCKTSGTIEYRSRPLPGRQVVRTRLLAGTFRICDELDGTWTRVKAPARLWASTVPDESKLHWLSCWFLDSVEVNVTDRHVEVELCWRVPRRSDDELISLIKELLFRFRERKIRGEVEQVNAMYQSTGWATFQFAHTIKGLEGEPRPFAMKSEPELITLLRNFKASLSEAPPTIADLPLLKSPRRPSKQHRQEIPRSEVPASENTEQTRTGTLIPRRGASPSRGRTPVERVLRDWYQDNRIAKHVQLVKGDHTDTYVRCRNLVSEAKLTTFLAGEIADKFRSEQIRSVIGVGTSSIALAVAVAYRLSCDVSFTFAASLGASGAPPRHSGFEVPPVVPILEEGGRILVLDEVVSGGRQARAVGNELFKLSSGTIDLQEQVKHFSLFHLGSRELDPQLNIEFFCHIPEVYYADAAEQCHFCQQGDPLTMEPDL